MTRTIPNIGHASSVVEGFGSSPVTRRSFLGKLSSTTATAAAIAPAAALAVDEPFEEAVAADETAYRETAHVRTYYALARR
ncbi:MAG: hypothetical protein APF80_13650 [Alphaproteobacteria bacterium BRH_c36]|nr:MAG: hypothetical protein APF80_13650 [Alphaproteobacteria bacterium BRH_c36]